MNAITLLTGHHGHRAISLIVASLVVISAGTVAADRFVYCTGNRCVIFANGEKEGSFALPAEYGLVGVTEDYLIAENRGALNGTPDPAASSRFWFHKAPIIATRGSPPGFVAFPETAEPRRARFVLDGAPYKPPVDLVSYLHRDFAHSGGFMVGGINYFPLDSRNRQMTNFLVKYDLTSGTFQRLTRSGLMVYSPTISPDDQWIAYYAIPFESRPELFSGRPSDQELKGMGLGIVRSDGTGERLIVPSGAYNVTEYAGISWSPDSATIFFQYRSTWGSPLQAIYRVSRDGTGLTKISGDHSLAQHPFCSNDGRYLLCAIENHVKNEAGKTSVVGGVARIDLETLNTRLLTDDGGMSPKLSPSGTQIIYNALSKEKPGAESLWFLDIESGKSVNLTPTRSVSTRHAFWLDQ